MFRKGLALFLAILMSTTSIFSSNSIIRADEVPTDDITITENGETIIISPNRSIDK